MGRVALALWVLAVGGSCARKAPGPAECEALAVRLVSGGDRSALAVEPLKAAADRITVECLTLPYDRAMLKCVEAGRGARICAAEMRARAERRQPTAELRRN